MHDMTRMIRRLVPTSVWFLALVALSGPLSAQTPPVSPEIQRFADLMVHRLALMELVAADKWRRGTPIVDAGREQRVIDAGKHVAMEAGLDPETVEPFIRAQMEAAKALQVSLVDDWEQGARPPPAQAPNLATVTRPAISAATSDILRQLVRVLPLLQDTRTQAVLVNTVTGGAAQYGLSESDVRSIVEAAASVAHARPSE